MKKTKYVIGPFQTFQQAWSAMRDGHFVRRSEWPQHIAYMLSDSPMQETFMMVDLEVTPPTATPDCSNISAADILCADWEVLKKAWK